VPDEVPFSSQLMRCARTVSQVVRPDSITAAVYYPAAQGSFPLILYAHAKRTRLYCPEHIPQGLDRAYFDHTQDFLRGARIHAHLASHGFVVVVPDLGWLMHMYEGGAWDAPPSLARSRLLVALHEHLARHPQWFGGRADPRRLALFGHSTGGSACMTARQRLPHARLLGLLAPAAFDAAVHMPDPPPVTVVIAGDRDTSQGVRPDLVYEHSRRPRALVVLRGANHLGYTELCRPDNRVCADLDTPGEIARDAQQDAAAAYLTAAARYVLLGDEDMRPYLEGRRQLGVRVATEVRSELSAAG
jgi:dienelactone hydrolase